MMLKAVTLVCLMALLPALSSGRRCLGRGRQLDPYRKYSLKLKWRRRSACISVTTDPGFRFVMDCSRRRMYFDTGYNGCDKNSFTFYPGGNAGTKGDKYCGEYEDLVLRSDGPAFYADWLNERRFSRNNGVKCRITMEKNSGTTTQKPALTTSKPAVTSQSPAATTAKPGPTIPSPAGCACGKHNTEGARIVNGQETKPNEYPFFAGLYGYGSKLPFCGGSLISEKWVLTAAHCLQEDRAEDIFVVLGGHNLYKNEASRKRFRVEKIINHENYNKRNDDNDVAVIKLQGSVKMSSTISAVCLPPKGLTQESYSQYGIVMGYGNTQWLGQQSSVLLDVKLRLLSAQQCGKIQPQMNGELTDGMFCAYELGKDSCQGDSGGPLVFEKGNKLVQVGIVSHGVNCSAPNHPGVYAKVEKYNDWIIKKTGNTYCGL